MCRDSRARFWILDNITPLRQLQASTIKSPAVLFRPQTAWRVRWDTNTDTPLPPDEPAGENPPDGVMIDYYVGSNASGLRTLDNSGKLAPVTLEIKDEDFQVVRRYSSADPIPTPDPALSIPPYWVRPQQRLPSEPGLHRFLWDLHYDPVPNLQPQYPIAAVYRNTPPELTSPRRCRANTLWCLPLMGRVISKL